MTTPHTGGSTMETETASPRTRGTRAPRPPRPPKPMSATQRNKLAVLGIVTTLGVSDEKVATIAALEAVLERLAYDSDLRERICEKYKEIAALGTGVRQTRQKADPGPVPIPIRAGTPEQYSPYGKFDPYQLNWEYGEKQLRAVLVRGTQRDLREATNIVMARNPGTKPTSRSDKDAMVDYIVECVAGHGY